MTQSIVKSRFLSTACMHTGSKAEEEEAATTKSAAVLRWRFSSFTKSVLPLHNV